MAYTDYPEVDIKTHRSIAKWQGRLAALFFFGGLLATQTHDIASGSLVVAVGAIAWAGANSYRVQALQWELEETKNKEE